MKAMMVFAPTLTTLLFIYALFYLLSSSFIGGLGFESISVEGSSHATAFIAALFVAIVGWVLSKRLVSDVMAWTTMHESQESFLARERRVNLVKDLMQDVLADPNCVRCVLVGHSLGSAMILDAFLRLNSQCRATNISESDRMKSANEVRKVSHIFTIGSPIQKIASLFYADSGENHRYHRVRHSNPYLLDQPAWGDHGGPRIVNLWSRYDPVSSEISSLLQPLRLNSVEDDIVGVTNIEVAPIGAPLPLSAHSGYFKDSSSMAVIYQAIASGNLSDTRTQRAHYKSKISFSKVAALAAFFLFSTGLMGWFIISDINDARLTVTAASMALISLIATFISIRWDYRRHRDDT